MICQAYEENVVDLKTIKESISKFKKGEFELEDKPRIGRPKETAAGDFQGLLYEDFYKSTRKLDRLLNVDYSLF